MVKVIITEYLEKEINKKFKNESIKIFELLLSLKNNPNNGKVISQIGDIVIKEIKYMSFRFYFITDGYSLKILK